MACYQGHDKVITLLLRHTDININLAQKDNATPLFIASQQGHEKIVALLLGHVDIKINLATKNNRTPLYIASAQGHAEVVALLLGQREEILRGTHPLQARVLLPVEALELGGCLVDGRRQRLFRPLAQALRGAHQITHGYECAAHVTHQFGVLLGDRRLSGASHGHGPQELVVGQHQPSP